MNKFKSRFNKKDFLDLKKNDTNSNKRFRDSSHEPSLNSTRFKLNQSEGNFINITEKINKIKKELKESVDKDKFNNTFDTFPFLQENNNYQKGVNNRTIYPQLRRHVNNMLKLTNIFETNNNFKKVTKLRNLPRFKSLTEKVEVSKSMIKTTFAKLAYSLARIDYGSPSEQKIIRKLLSNPKTKNMIEEALKNQKNKVIYSNGIQKNFQILHKRSHYKIVDKNSTLLFTQRKRERHDKKNPTERK